MNSHQPPPVLDDSPAPALAAARRWAPLAASCGLIVMTVAAYDPAAGNGFLWDDSSYLRDLQPLRTVRGLRLIWTDLRAAPQYYPLVFTSFWAEYRLWGANPAGYHVVNILLHAANAVLAYLLLRRLGCRAAWLAAAIFGVHPVNVESVAWIAERKNMLSAFFALPALLAYMRFSPICGEQPRAPIPATPGQSPATPRRSPARREGSSRTRRNWWWYGLSFLLFILALLSKTTACVLPVVILLLLWWRSARFRFAELPKLIPFLLVGAGMGLLTVHLETTRLDYFRTAPELSLVERFLAAGRALWFYGRKMAWPAELVPVYPRWSIHSGTWWHYLFPAAAMATAAGLYLARRTIGKGPLAGTLLFGAALFPASGLFPVTYQIQYSLVADHFFYLSSIAAAGLAAGAVQEVCRRAGLTRRRVLWPAAAIVLAALGLLSWRHEPVYRDGLTMWRQTAAMNPNCSKAHNNLGFHLLDLGQTSAAMVEFNRAIELDRGYAPAYNNRGEALRRRGDLKGAIRDFTTALALNPRDARAAHNRALAYFSSRDYQKAWMDVNTCRRLGGTIEPGFLAALRRAAGRDD